MRNELKTLNKMRSKKIFGLFVIATKKPVSIIVICDGLATCHVL